MKEELIKITDLSVTYGNYEALKNVNLSIYQDDFIGVIGPNGGGKTTLVKAIMGTVAHTGKVIHAPLLYNCNARRLIGYLPQRSEFDSRFPISVRELILSGLQLEKGLFSKYSKNDLERVAYLMEVTNVTNIANNAICEISGGQMQRALLCRALMAEPKLLILDEPANFVDNKFENELYDLLAELNKRMAIIMVSHDIGTITSVVKNIVCVNKHVHRHDSNIITAEQLNNYDCPIQLISHGEVPHTVLRKH